MYIYRKMYIFINELVCWCALCNAMLYIRSDTSFMKGGQRDTYPVRCAQSQFEPQRSYNYIYLQKERIVMSTHFHQTLNSDPPPPPNDIPDNLKCRENIICDLRAGNAAHSIESHEDVFFSLVCVNILVMHTNIRSCCHGVATRELRQLLIYVHLNFQHIYDILFLSSCSLALYLYTKYPDGATSVCMIVRVYGRNLPNQVHRLLPAAAAASTPTTFTHTFRNVYARCMHNLPPQWQDTAVLIRTQCSAATVRFITVVRNRPAHRRGKQ